MRGTRIIALAMFVLLITSAWAAAETITLWDGVKINVEVKSVSPKGAVVIYDGQEFLLPWLEAMTPDEAVRVWESHIVQQDAEAWFQLGMFAYENKRVEKAKELFAKAASIDPSYKDKSPLKPDPSADRKEILRLLAEAKKAESARIEAAIEMYEDVLNWPNSGILDEVLRETDYLNTAMLEDHVNRLRKSLLVKLNLTQMGLRWVTDAERKTREKDIEERGQSVRLDATENERRATWDNAWERNGRWFTLRTNVPKWYFQRYQARLDIIYDDLQKTLNLRLPAEKKMKVFVYGSRDLYASKAAGIKPGSAGLGGFYAEESIHFFLETEQEDLTYEDLSVMSFNYLATVLYLHMIATEVPFWFESGLGLYYQDASWNSIMQMYSGKTPNRYAAREFRKMLKAGSVYDPAKVFAVKENPTKWDYLCAWATVQYLFDKQNATLSSSFMDGIKLLPTAKDTFKNLTSKAEQLKTEVPKYMAGLVIPPIVITPPPYPLF